MNSFFWTKNLCVIIPLNFEQKKYSNKISKKFKFDYLSFLLFLKINHTNRMKKGDFGFWEFSAVFAILL